MSRTADGIDREQRFAAAGRSHAVRRWLLLSIFAGGAAGALARAGLDQALSSGGAGWPWSTFLVNVSGTALLGYFATRLQERLPPSTFPRPLLGTGLCGALTTFSTFQVELIRLGRNGHPGLAAGYLAASVCAGLFVVVLSTKLVRRARLA